MDIATEMRNLARNLYWTWQPDVVNLFRSLDPAVWREVNHNPVEFLERFSPEQLQQQAVDLALEARISHAYHRLRAYLAGKRTWGEFNACALATRPVAYFSAEFGLHESLPIYSGGLGVLSGDHLKSASDLGLPLVGVGLLYAKGYFTQVLDEGGWQREHYYETDIAHLPLDRARDAAGAPLQVSVRTRDSEIRIALWTVMVGRNRLLLLDADVAGNSQEDRLLTASLYGGDQSTRIRQELILGVGGLRALGALGIVPGVIHMNEGHSAFSVLERARLVMERDGRGFDEVRESVAASTVFTTHTPVAAGHDRFDAVLVEEVVGDLRESLGLGHEEFMALGRVRPEDAGESFCMTVLGLKMSRFANGVSALHGQVSRAMWRSLWPGVPEHGVPIGHITNGVHLSSWLAPDMARLFTRYLRQDWFKGMCYRDTWQPVGEIPDLEFWEAQEILKVRLVNYVRRVALQQGDRRGEAPAYYEALRHRLDPAALTVGFARRFATYKRANLLFEQADRLARLVNDEARPVQFIFSGKAHPADEPGKRIIQRIVEIARDPRFAGRVVFLENHDINVARHLVQGADVWLNSPRRPLEACGTSGQKVLLNGGLNLSVLDGWWAEAYDGANGFAIGEGGEHSDPDEQDRRDAEATFRLLEDRVVPMFYGRDADGVPREWVRMMKHAIASLAHRFNADRMVMDYTRRCYLPALGAVCSAMPDPRAW